MEKLSECDLSRDYFLLRLRAHLILVALVRVDE
jgi:hypothetical protein